MSFETTKEHASKMLARWEAANKNQQVQDRLIADQERLWRLARDLASALGNLLVHAGSPPPGAPVPRVPGYPDGRGGLRMWCAWCDRWHYHSPGYGHRGAHCHKGNSPYRNTGYTLTDPATLALRTPARAG